ncbi:hypothetical protein DRQ25_10785 [Candidatus Fermentibacteria bacterium]|nr:MAG: hypothetical protein DRQ25_10785 [Candidatus Fermentibacteria bacterium]
MAKISKARALRQQIARLAAKQRRQQTHEAGGPKVRNMADYDPGSSTMKVEGVSGMVDNLRAGTQSHFKIDDPDMPYSDQARYDRAHQLLLQNDDGSPVFESMGLLFDEGNRKPQKRGNSPGMWMDETGELNRSPTTEYTFDKAEPWRQNLAGDYAMAVMGQDGVAISDMQPGLPRGPGYVSIMRQPGSGIEKSLDKLGLLESQMDSGFTGPGPRVGLGSDTAFGAPGSRGDIIGSMGEISPAEAMRWKMAIGDGAEMFHRPGGDDAYRAAQGYKYSSVADNLGNVKNSFLERGMAKEFDVMLRQSAKQSVEAYKKMGNISRTKGNPNFGIVWDHLNMKENKGRMADEILQELIDTKTISMEEMNAIMQQFSPQSQPQGLLA